MLEPGVVEGARAPLFERLVDLEPKVREEPRPFRMLNRRELRESVRREMERLLNTRCPIPPHLLYGRVRSVVDYGVPDLVAFSPRSADDQNRLRVLMAKTIEAYEPRLRRVRVVLETFDRKGQALQMRVEGDLVVGAITEPVSFPTVIQRKSGEVEVG